MIVVNDRSSKEARGSVSYSARGVRENDRGPDAMRAAPLLLVLWSQVFDPMEVQQCTLLSIKTGGCTEDCKYCSQVRDL